MIADKKIWYDARKETKIDALPSKYQGLMAYEMTAQMKNPLFTVMNFGKSAARPLPAGREFSKMEEKIAQYANTSAMKKHPVEAYACLQRSRSWQPSIKNLRMSHVFSEPCAVDPCRATGLSPPALPTVHPSMATAEMMKTTSLA